MSFQKEDLTVGGFAEQEGSIDALLSGLDLLRLYIIPLGVNSMVIGNGCHKLTRRFQDTPACNSAQNLLAELDKQMRERMAEGELKWERRWCDEYHQAFVRLAGNMQFEIGDC